MSDWYIAQPWWLVLALLALPVLVISHRRPPGLPGAWSRVIQPELQPYIVRWLPIQRRTAIRLAHIALICLLAIALANISVGTTSKLPERALHGRAMIIDTSVLSTTQDLLFSARQLAAAAPDIPTAIVAASASAYDVVPLTSDPVQLDRYLQVLDSSLIPDPGRRLQPTVERAGSMLDQAGVLAGQIILLSAGSAPRPASPVPRGQATLWIFLAREPDQAWRDYAASVDAQIISIDALGEINTLLLDRRDRNARQLSAIEEGRRITPWAIGFCLPLWALLFFRRQES